MEETWSWDLTDSDTVYVFSGKDVSSLDLIYERILLD